MNGTFAFILHNICFCNVTYKYTQTRALLPHNYSFSLRSFFMHLACCCSSSLLSFWCFFSLTRLLLFIVIVAFVEKKKLLCRFLAYTIGFFGVRAVCTVSECREESSVRVLSVNAVVCSMCILPWKLMYFCCCCFEIQSGARHQSRRSHFSKKKYNLFCASYAYTYPKH